MQEPERRRLKSRRGRRPMELAVDPTQWSLNESSWRTTLPGPFCPEVGRRLLLAQLEFSEWTLRRVEKIKFERDRSVARSISIDLLVRDDAPVLRDSSGERCWLVPVSSMCRRTLVNFQLRDEANRPISTPGIRFTQQLDMAMLMAAAALTPASSQQHDAEIREFIQRFVAGRLDQVITAMRLYRGLDGPHPDYLLPLVNNTPPSTPRSPDFARTSPCTCFFPSRRAATA